MRLAIVSVATLMMANICLCLLAQTAIAVNTRNAHYLKPIWLRASSTNGRSDAGTGRGLMAKLMMFKNMFQQPQSNVIIIRTPTTTTTTTDPTTTTATRMGRVNDGERLAAADADMDDEQDADLAKVIVPPATSMGNSVNNKIALDVASDAMQANENQYISSNNGSGGARKRHHHNARHRQHQHMAMHSTTLKDNAEYDNDGNSNDGGNKRRQQKRRRNRRNRRKQHPNQQQNNNSNDVKSENMSGDIDNLNVNTGIEHLDSGMRKQVRNILHSLRRQTPVDYNY